MLSKKGTKDMKNMKQEYIAPSAELLNVNCEVLAFSIDEENRGDSGDGNMTVVNDRGQWGNLWAK